MPHETSRGAIVAVARHGLSITSQHHRGVPGTVATAAFDLDPAAGDDLAVRLSDGGAGEALGTGGVGVPDAAFAEGAVTATVGEEAAGGEVLRALGDPDAFLSTDLGVRRALERMGQGTEPSSATALAERWRPWRAYAVQHLVGEPSARPQRAAAPG